MTHKEAVLVSAYTGVLLTKDFSDVHKLCEELLGRPVFTHELAFKGVQEEIKERCRPAIMEMIDHETSDEDGQMKQYQISKTISAEEAEMIRKIMSKEAGTIVPEQIEAVEPRPCRATLYKGGKAEEVFGHFHQWGTNYEELSDGVGIFTTAIIETFDGSVVSCPAETVEFLDWAEGSAE